MNDILPKPFTQDGLLDMLEVFIVVVLLILCADYFIFLVMCRNISCTSKSSNKWRKYHAQ